jgi:putative DNA primase/helicase
MTGGDRITARFLHHEFFEFEPTFKLWLAVNHKPRITGSDYAIWRRIRLIPFTVTIPEKERDPDLTEKLKEELPGILAWVAAGCRAWQAEGLRAPNAIMAATKEYRDESDMIASFIDERCKVGPDCEVSKARLYEAYAEWCEKSGERPLTKRELGGRFLEKGFSDARDMKGRFWRGIDVRRTLQGLRGSVPAKLMSLRNKRR